ncbi:protease I [Pseudobutyrivibrio sp. ACV-2]|uniref:DJ-1/PfpI family protein n=1 Tax=Pseudobutyrivibrio sp. ACV-2 TaxID=1520801 RepID=UPI0008977520|nr:DJ-1/PfpI family protein [Pseudobutyrivibrio sp. ACV-2]SEA83329.1 protease I [Pseudobutyrivibrio sp. ACV-2]
MKKILMLLGDYAEDYEVMVPYQILKFACFNVDCIAPDRKSGDKIKTAIHDFLGDATYKESEGHQFLINKDFDKIALSEYDGLYITGGRAPEYLRLDPRVINLVKFFHNTGKPVAAICHGIQILTAADLVRGKKLTCYPAVEPEVTMAGGTYVNLPDDEAITDGMLVTSPAWPGIYALMQQFIRLIF